MAEPLSTARSRFEVLCAEAEPPLGLACALLAAEERSGVEADDLVAMLDVMAEGLWLPPDATVVERVARLNHHLFTHLGFDGDRDDYGAPENSLLDRVLERRRGLPILLCIVAMEVGRRAGIELEGVGFPGHFLVAPVGADPRFWIDPFNGGRILVRDVLVQRLQTMAARTGGQVGPPDRWLRSVGSRYILVRVCNNLKGAWLRAGDVEAALRAVERLLLLEPELHEEQRDRGLMLHHLGRYGEAATELERYLEAWPTAPDRERIEQIIASLRA